MFVSESMSTKLITVDPDMTISEARGLMYTHRIRHLPVIDQEGKLLGIVTDRDMRDAMPSTLLKKPDYNITLGKIMKYPVKDIMTKDPTTVGVFYTIQDTLLVVEDKKFGALPVVDEDGYLKGILSVRDLLKAFINVMGIGESGTLLCILAEEKTGQMKKIIDIITEQKISLGSVQVARYWDTDKRAIFPYVLTNNVIVIKQKLLAAGFELIDPMQWYLDQLPHKD